MTKKKAMTALGVVLAALLAVALLYGAVSFVDGVKAWNRAEELVSAVTDPELKEALSVSQIQKDLKILDKRMFLMENLTIRQINGDGRVEYSYFLGEDVPISYLDVWKDADGRENIRVQENELLNILSFQGKNIYLNGTKVEIE